MWDYGKDGNWGCDLISGNVPCVSLRLDLWELKDVVEGITGNAGLALILSCVTPQSAVMSLPYIQMYIPTL